MLAQFSEAGFWWWTGERFVPKLVKKTHDFFFVTTVCTYVYDIMAIYILCLHEINSFFFFGPNTTVTKRWVGTKRKRADNVCIGTERV